MSQITPSIPKSNNVDFTIIVLTYNRPYLLRRCVDSIVNLEKSNILFEVIVVDDGSEFSNFSVVADYEGSLNIRFHKRNHRGVAAARNTGIKLASGRLIAFVADDYVLPRDFLTDTVKFLELHDEAYVITHNVLPCGPSWFKHVQRLYFYLALWQSIENPDPKANVLQSYVLPPSRGAVFRKEIFQLIGFFNEDLQVGEDGEFGMRMASRKIPIYFFPHKYIEHWEQKDLWGYLDQRLSYGKSYFRALKAQNIKSQHNELSFFRIFIVFCCKKYFIWLRLAWKTSRSFQYLLLSPFIVLFLLFFYWGFYKEFRQNSASNRNL